MRKFYWMLMLSLIISSCNVGKRAEKSLNSGNYTEAFDVLIKQYQKGVSEKKYAAYLPMLQQAYMRMVETEEQKVERWKMENNSAYLSNIYNTLVQLDRRQSQIQALMPMYHQGEVVHFPTKDYSKAIYNVKQDYASELYAEAERMMRNSDKNVIRQAYSKFVQVNNLIPGYRNVSNLMHEAHNLGVTHVLVEIENSSFTMLPHALNQELRSIITYDLDGNWTQFHEQAHASQAYDYLVKFSFDNILVSPERQSSRLYNYEKEVSDGFYNIRDAQGNIVRDSLGNPVRHERFVTVRARVEEFFLEKDSHVSGILEIYDAQRQRRLTADPLRSDFTFQEHFALFTGDKRAIPDEMIPFLVYRPVGFPSSEQMVYDSGTQLKAQIRDRLRRIF
ncbi:MAG: hypothetical protein Q4F57_10000 [Weeksellaceae bacterium]|nr:hypothetical protein [Weeksellaceae bacterium]